MSDSNSSQLLPHPLKFDRAGERSLMSILNWLQSIPCDQDVAFRHNVISIKHRSSLVSRNCHRHSLRNSNSNHVSHRRSAQIMKYLCVESDPIAGFLPWLSRNLSKPLSAIMTHPGTRGGSAVMFPVSTATML